MQLGNGKWESTIFNNRLQPTQIALGTIQNGTDKLDIDYGYGTTANNGNVLSQTITVPGLAQPFLQNYTYEELNRLKTATETNNGTQTWDQVFGYDRFGNRNITSGLGQTSLSFSGNRIMAHTYDTGGNTTNDGTRTFTYDAENKQNAVNNGSTGDYFYDGDGKRVKKIVPGGETTVFVYDAVGKLVAEYSTVVASQQDAKVAYLTNDHLGSPRINTDQNGTVKSRHDYRPFGEEVLTPQRTSTYGYAADTVRKQFTGYERDSETSLDFAEARMYENRYARFTAVDPLIASGKSANPQSFNRYIYVLNNPLLLVDRDGLCPQPSNLQKGQVGFCLEAFIMAERAGPGNRGHGDNRNFSGEDGSLTARIQVQFVLEATDKGVIFASPITMSAETSKFQVADQAEGGFAAAKIGEMRPDGTLSAPGQGSATATVTYDPSKVRQGDFGNTEVNVTATGKNGFQAAAEQTLQKIPTATTQGAAAKISEAMGSIDFSKNFRISGSGFVEKRPSAVKGYPSYGAYSYTRSSDGSVRTKVHYEIKEGTIDELAKPMKRIQ